MQVIKFTKVFSKFNVEISESTPIIYKNVATILGMITEIHTEKG